MALADYRLCDVCERKTFYDAELNYNTCDDARPALFNGADYSLSLDYLGAWAVVCNDCRDKGYGAMVTAPEGDSIEHAKADLAAARDALNTARAECERLRADAGQGEHNILALLDHYQEEEHREYRARILAEESFRRALVEGLAECERLRGVAVGLGADAVRSVSEGLAALDAAIRADAAREERERAFRAGYAAAWDASGEGFNGEYTHHLFTHERWEAMRDEAFSEYVANNAHAPGKGGEG